MTAVSGFERALKECDTLKRWLVEAAYPLWWTAGANFAQGGFEETVNLDGTPTHAARRARLNPRQIYSYSRARKLGWNGPADTAVKHGLDFFLAHYLRDDQLFRTRVAPDGASLDDSIVLYDQAFALLGLAAAYDVSHDERLRDIARGLHDQLRARLAHPLGGFNESVPPIEPLLANSHMHLLECALEWSDLDADPRWPALAQECVNLLFERFLDASSGFVLEFFDSQWHVVPGIPGRIAEPGHQFEWAWLLLRWGRQNSDDRAIFTGLRLVALGEKAGVDAKRGVAINSLLTDGTIHDNRARLWPQTERIKAACLAAEITREPHYWDTAADAAEGLMKYLLTPTPGLWYDIMTPEGALLDQPAPASSFYHIVCATAELERCLVADTSQGLQTT